MKKITFTFLILTFLIGFTKAQVNVTNDTIRLTYDVSDLSADNNDENLWHVKLINSSSSSVKFKVTKITSSTTVTTGHSLFFCDVNCYAAATIVSPNDVTINGLSTFTSFSSHIQHGGTSGESMVKYEFSNSDISSENKYVVFKYNVTTLTSLTPENPAENHYINLDFTTGISNNKSIESSKISVSPNPADNKIFVSLSNNNLSKSTFKIYDLLGNLVTEKESNGNDKIEIGTESFSNGIYYLKLEQENKIVSTKKFVVAH
ncbi:MAG: T9SS type A sorting domain-containing protein [Bacteroidota bacterium]